MLMGAVREKKGDSMLQGGRRWKRRIHSDEIESG